MYYEIVRISQEYKESKITPEEAMDSILDILFPKIFTEDYNPYVQRLIAFMWGVTEDDLINLEPKREGDTTLFKAKCMFTKIISYNKTASGKYINKTKLAKLVGVNSHVSAIYRLKQHDVFYEMEKDYKYIYDIIKEILL